MRVPSYEHTEEMQVIFHKSMDLLTSSILFIITIIITPIIVVITIIILILTLILQERELWGGLGVDGRTILEWTLKR